MGLMERISEDLKHAMKIGDKLRLETLRSLRAQLQEKEIAKRGHGGITEEDEVGVLKSAVKNRKESIEMFERGGRQDLVEQETRELEIIHTYLPKQLSSGELELIVGRIIEDLGAASSKEFGKVMGVAMRDLKGKADGKLVQEIVKKKLEGP